MNRTISILTGVAFVLGLCAVAALAQDGAPKVVNGGVLNGKAVSLPKPVYPEAARNAGISAAIAVDILIDETGAVISADADPYDQRERRDVDGNKLEPVEADASLREAAENAACQARFSPTLLDGQPVQVKGRIVYNFLTDKLTAEKLTVVGGPRTATGGVLNGKAVDLSAPAYPAAARAVNAQGTVVVQILIGEAGSVLDAAAVSGHPLLRAASEKAAREAKFEPTYLDGKPIKVSGVLTYNFVLPKKEDQP